MADTRGGPAGGERDGGAAAVRGRERPMSSEQDGEPLQEEAEQPGPKPRGQDGTGAGTGPGTGNETAPATGGDMVSQGLEFLSTLKKKRTAF